MWGTEPAASNESEPEPEPEPDPDPDPDPSPSPGVPVRDPGRDPDPEGGLGTAVLLTFTAVVADPPVVAPRRAFAVLSDATAPTPVITML